MPKAKSGVSRRQLEANQQRTKVWPFLAPLDPRGMPVLLAAWLEHISVRGHSERTVRSAKWCVSEFIV